MARMPQKEQTIAEMTLTAIGGDIFGKGAERAWYPTFDETLLAIPTKFDLQAKRYLPTTETVRNLLENTTSLSTSLIVEPFFNGISPSMPGQPLAFIRNPDSAENTPPYVLFSTRIEGKSFRNLRLEGKLNLDQILSWQPEIFEHLMRQARTITEAGLDIDKSDSNIMLNNNWKKNTPKLAIIDTGDFGEPVVINDFFEILDFFSGFLNGANEENRKSLYKLLVDAAVKEGFGSNCIDDMPHDFPEEYKDLLRAIPPLIVDPDARKFPPELTAIGTLPLTASVSDLKGFLKDIENAKCGRTIT